LQQYFLGDVVAAIVLGTAIGEACDPSGQTRLQPTGQCVPGSLVSVTHAPEQVIEPVSRLHEPSPENHSQNVLVSEAVLNTHYTDWNVSPPATPGLRHKIAGGDALGIRVEGCCLQRRVRVAAKLNGHLSLPDGRTRNGAAHHCDRPTTSCLGAEPDGQHRLVPHRSSSRTRLRAIPQLQSASTGANATACRPGYTTLAGALFQGRGLNLLGSSASAVVPRPVSGLSAICAASWRNWSYTSRQQLLGGVVALRDGRQDAGYLAHHCSPTIQKTASNSDNAPTVHCA
jgi:hypothetical protein